MGGAAQAHAARLDGIERADSVAVSAHKWLFQPKESALLLFRDAERAHRAISFGGGYPTVPNVGLLGSQGAAAVPLMATALAWGREGLAARLAGERWFRHVAANPNADAEHIVGALRDALDATIPGRG